jgi:prolyl oligopeptidase PreP (S9A serine peptidase family)
MISHRSLPGRLRLKHLYEPGERESLAGVMTTLDFIVIATMENVQGKAEDHASCR